MHLLQANEDEGAPEPTHDHTRSRLMNQDGGLSLDALRIDVSRHRSSRDCAAEGHRWSYLPDTSLADVAGDASGTLVCAACGQGAARGAGVPAPPGVAGGP